MLACPPWPIVVWSLVLASACGDRIRAKPSASETTSHPSTDDAGDHVAVTTAIDADTTGETGLPWTSGAKPFDSSFLPASDLPADFWCDVLTQDCPAGEKCMPWAEDGSPVATGTGCFPVASDPKKVGEPCESFGHYANGLDDCVAGAVCLQLGGADDEVCVALCTGTQDQPICDAPGYTCNVSGQAAHSFCVPACDPIAQDCAGDYGCYPVVDGWACAPDASGVLGGVGEPCGFANACDIGVVCVAAGVVGCKSQEGCCTPLCVFTDANADAICQAIHPAHICAPWYVPGNAPPGYEDVGVCMIAA